MAHLPSTFTPITEGWTVKAVSPTVPAGVGDGAFLATVPGGIHVDLIRAGLIDDPFDGANETAQQWIGDTVWRYETTFTWREDGNSRHDLVAYGLDTVATIELNGSLVAHTQNQYRTYRFDARPFLVDGVNTLAVMFAAPVPEALARAEAYGSLPHVNHHEYNQLRKMASSFGWDWGIDVAGSGIWKPIGLDSWSGVRIAEVRPLVDVDGKDGILTAHVELERDGVGQDEEERVEVTVGGVTSAGTVAVGETDTVIVLRVSSAKLWWPVGHGSQPLYDIEVAARDDRWSGRVGFRTVCVDTTPDETGIPFTVTVNDTAVLIRGVNWIPDHAFITEIDHDRYARRLADAVEANANLIRVWGGGLYESDDFYDLADQHGLLVWQDFLFACAAYAEEEQLSTEIEAEAREQIARLSPHPSLVIWNGNNENVWGSVDWGWGHKLNGRTWGNGYYRELFPDLLAELDPSRFYSPASPYSFAEYRHPNDPRAGTTHVWDVWNTLDYTAYQEYTPRFVSEFGFQGPPAWSTLARVVHDDPLDPYGDEMLVHQKAHRGNEKLERGLAGHFPAPTTIDDWHWATQLNQAHAVRFGIEHFRSLAPLNTGTILWQLNDNWPVVSWSTVDFDEHRKPAWYALRSAYAHRLATFQPRSSVHAQDAAFEGSRPELDETALVLLNDTSEPFDGDFIVSRERIDGSVIASTRIAASVAPRGQLSLTIPENVAHFGDRTTEVIVARTVDESTGFEPAFQHGADVIVQRLEQSSWRAIAEHRTDGYSVAVTALSLTRDIFLHADRVDPLARVDRGLVTLTAGETATFTISSRADVPPTDFLGETVLRTANSLL